MENEKIILWIQAKSVDDVNLLFHNGVLINKDDVNYMELYRKLVEKDKYKKIISTDNLSVYKQHIKGEQCYLIHSNFAETDVAGRQIGFMALVSGADNLSDALEKLINESKPYGYSCRKSDVEIVKKKSGVSFRILMLLGILLLVIILLYCI
ncbi:hypothetical protein [Bacteroides stercorirosoris]|uniref:Uncharacterized protein n=1 Tax=Bacteroides stercorirosoris TaxID=871324 RepID=A0A1M6CHC6_9BACE|nr:hypothetical protein [Bacteroides stercorirosoris]SHI60154.1 hypothetical protein SAMN05444350_104136 [Bacteroides stercorirosoris]